MLITRFLADVTHTWLAGYGKQPASETGGEHDAMTVSGQ